uniref:FBA_2 domain-containing protein n=1 Tax=Caenorhabditis tropicalis TaxID=1561998 RepID=A0A1I7T3U0_9PELO
MHLRDENSFWEERIKLDFREKRIRCRISSHPDTGIPILWCKSEYKTLLPMTLHHYICDIFNLSSDIQIKFRASEISEFPDTNVVDNLKVDGYILEERDDHRMFFENLQINNCFDLSSEVFIEPESSILSVNYLRYASYRITKDHLIKFRGRGAWFTNSYSIKTDDVIAFIEDWYYGSNTKLEVMSVGLGRTEDIKVDRSRVFKFFRVLPWDPKKRGGRFKYPQAFAQISRRDLADCFLEMDIERESDGMLATIMIDDDKFRFYVWHERFPDPSTTQPILYTRPGDHNLFFVTGNVHF